MCLFFDFYMQFYPTMLPVPHFWKGNKSGVVFLFYCKSGTQQKKNQSGLLLWVSLRNLDSSRAIN